MRKLLTIGLGLLSLTASFSALSMQESKRAAVYVQINIGSVDASGAAILKDTFENLGFDTKKSCAQGYPAPEKNNSCESSCSFTKEKEECVPVSVFIRESYEDFVGECNFGDQNLDNKSFRNAAICNGNFNSCKLRRANLGSTKCFGANFANSDLTYANLSCAEFKDAQFENIQLDCATLTEANFTGARFSGSTSFKYACLEKTIFSNVIFGKDVNFKGANIANADFRGAQIKVQCEESGEIILQPIDFDVLKSKGAKIDLDNLPKFDE